MTEAAQKDLDGKTVPMTACSVETTHKYVWVNGNFRVSVSETGYDSLIEKLEKKKTTNDRTKFLIEWVHKRVKVIHPDATVSPDEWAGIVKELSLGVSKGPVITQVDDE